MVMERLNAASRHPENGDPVKQFAISQATKLLVDAGVKDPGPITAETSPLPPERVIRLPDLTIGGVRPKELSKLLATNGHRVSDYAEDIMKKMPTLPHKQAISLVRTTISAMGLSGNPTTDQIYEKANELGWDLCPAEVGPHLRLTYKDQPMNEWLCIGMKQITDRHGIPGVFRLGRRDDGLWLRGPWAAPEYGWDPGDGFVFSLRKSAEGGK